MKKAILALMMTGVGIGLCTTGFAKKRDKKATPPPAAAKPAMDATMVPFTKAKKQMLERNNSDIRQLQFYVDQTIILRPMGGNDREVVKNGTIVKETAKMPTEIMIPAHTPVVCDRVNGDSLMIRFESSNNTLAFVAPYGSNNFTIQGTNWINGSADVMYNGKTHRILCGTCGNIAEVTLLVKEATNVNKPTGNPTTVSGVRVGGR